MKIGILCAIPKEIHCFELLPNSGQQVGGRTYFKSKHSFHELIIVECGIGKVNSAMVSTILIQEFKCEMLIFSGIAGGIDPDMEIGEVLIGDAASIHVAKSMYGSGAIISLSFDYASPPFSDVPFTNQFWSFMISDQG